MRFRPLLTWVAVAAVLGIITFLSGADSVSATTFNPELKVNLTTTTAEKPSDFTTDFDLAKGDVNFGGVVAFIPKEWGIVKGDSIPVGADVGTLTAAATLGLINSACNQAVPVKFAMMNGSLNTKDTVSFDDLNKNNTLDFADDDNNDGIANGVQKYPEFLTRLFKDLTPIRRSVGITPVAGTPVILQFLVFGPGTLIDANIPHDEARGYPSVTVLQNAGDPNVVPQPGVITDFCTPLKSHNAALGVTKDGTQLFVNPTDGTYTFSVVSVGLRDADGDGYENSLDTCPYDKNVGDPRVSNDGDLDSDGIDAACDPNDNDVNSDQDADGYQNRQDNCPLIANGEEERDKAGVGNQTDKDLDQIGDACDKNADNADTEGKLSFAERTTDVKIGAGGAAAGKAPSSAACPNCFKYVPGSTNNNGSSASSSSGSNTGLIVGIVVGVIAAIVIVGGGAAFMMRRRS